MFHEMRIVEALRNLRNQTEASFATKTWRSTFYILPEAFLVHPPVLGHQAPFNLQG